MLVTVLDVGKRNWTTSLESCGKDGSICLIAFASSSRCFTPRLVTSNKTRNDFSSCRILVSPFCNAGRADNTLSRHELLFPCEFRPVLVSTSPAQRSKRNLSMHSQAMEIQTPWHGATNSDKVLYFRAESARSFLTCTRKSSRLVDCLLKVPPCQSSGLWKAPGDIDLPGVALHDINVGAGA